MKIHTDRLNYMDFYAAARVARVEIHDLDMRKSQSRAYRFTFALTGESRRRPNFGKFPDDYAATWDQWGVFLAYLFARDAERTFDVSLPMHCGRDSYDSAEDFAAKTGDRFGAPEDVIGYIGYYRRFVDGGWPDDAHGDHRFMFDGTPFEQSCTKCSAVTRWGKRAAQYV